MTFSRLVAELWKIQSHHGSRQENPNCRASAQRKEH